MERAPLPSLPAADDATVKGEYELAMVLGDRRYRVRGWKKPLNPEALKVNLLVHRPADPDARFHVDTLDLYSAKARAGFVRAAGIELGEAEEVLKHDLGRVLLKLEEMQDAELATALSVDDRPAMSAAERADAMALLKAPDLMQRILADFSACGVVGEAVNIQTGYLACVSRLLDRPLAVIIQSSSAAGKSSLMDAVLALMPADAQVRYSAMTGQSLFYMGETNLKHRILAIAGLRHDKLTAPWVIPGAMDRAAFNTYVETPLAPTLLPGDIVILDNLSVHKSAKAEAAIRARGAWMLLLPQYPPDLNPIEMAFAKLKAHLRKAAARTFDALIGALGDICQLFEPKNAKLPQSCRICPRLTARCSKKPH